MASLLKFEYRKLLRSKSFYICFSIMIAALIFELAALKGTYEILAIELDMEEVLAEFTCEGFTAILGAINNSYFLLIAGIFTAIFICDDYDQHTLKNIYSRGYSRYRVILSKLIVLATAITVMFVLIEIVAFIFGTVFFGSGEIDGFKDGFKRLALLAVQYIACMANIGLYFTLCSLLKKKGFAIAAAIVLPTIIELLLNLFDIIVHFILFIIPSLPAIFTKLENFYVYKLWVSSFPFDLTQFSVEPKRIVGCLIGSVLYLAIFVLTGLFFNRKNEV